MFWIPLVPLWCHCANLINHKEVFEMLLNTTIYRPLLLLHLLQHTPVCQTEHQFAQKDPPPLAHCSLSILQSFLRPKYCGSKLTFIAPYPAPTTYPPSPLRPIYTSVSSLCHSRRCRQRAIVSTIHLYYALVSALLCTYTAKTEWIMLIDVEQQLLLVELQKHRNERRHR